MASTSARVRVLPNCQGEDPDLLPVVEAERRIRDSLVPLDTAVLVPLAESLDRILAEDIVSPLNVPPHRNSAMDGYAIRGTDLPTDDIKTLDVVGTAWAGRPHIGQMPEGTVVRIMTGAKMPDEADTVVIQEHAETDGERIRIDARHKIGQNVRQAGEDLRDGETVLLAGQRIGPAEMGLMGSLGFETIPVRPRLKVAVFSTGDEVRTPGQAQTDGGIYDSNRFTLQGMLRRLGADVLDMGVLPDNLATIQQALEDASSQADVVITSGGVSAGAADYVKETLEAIGQIGFWKIAIRPGRPLAFGRINNAAFFGLPGNPVAVMVTFYQFARPAIRTLMGETILKPEPLIDVRTASRLRKKPGRIEYYRAILDRDDSGELVVSTTGSSGSGLLHTMSHANCFVILDHDEDTAEVGDIVKVQPFFGLT